MKKLPDFLYGGLLIALFASIITGSCLAQGTKMSELKLKDGKVYKDVEVTKTEPDGIRITHSGGIAKVKYDRMAAKDKYKLGYTKRNAEEAAKFAQEEEAKQKEALKKVREKEANARKSELESVRSTKKRKDGGRESSGGTKAKQKSKGSVLRISITHLGSQYSLKKKKHAVATGGWSNWPIWKLKSGKIICLQGSGSVLTRYAPQKKGRLAGTNFWLTVRLARTGETQSFTNATGKSVSLPVYELVE